MLKGARPHPGSRYYCLSCMFSLPHKPIYFTGYLIHKSYRIYIQKKMRMIRVIEVSIIMKTIRVSIGLT